MNVAMGNTKKSSQILALTLSNSKLPKFQIAWS